MGRLYGPRGPVMESGVYLGDGRTTKASVSSIGSLIDSIAVPYWRNSADEPIRRLAAATSAKAMAEALWDVPGVGELNFIHVAEYLAIADAGPKELRYVFPTSGFPAALCSMGRNTDAFLRIGRRLDAGDDPELSDLQAALPF